ncbi:MAG: group 1 truncated hemoglobin [Polyangiales bacterium]
MRTTLTISILVALVACSAGTKEKGPDKPPSADNTLFARLGGQAAINAVVDEFVDMTGADPRISQYFTNVDKDKLKTSMYVHVCSISGGGCTYEGKSMLVAHTGMKLSQADFDAFMDDLSKTLIKLKVPEPQQGEVVAAFRAMQTDVVGH